MLNLLSQHLPSQQSFEKFQAAVQDFQSLPNEKNRLRAFELHRVWQEEYLDVPRRRAAQ